MDKETQMIVDKLDFFRDAIVHHDEYKTQDLIHWLAVAGDLIEELAGVKEQLSGMEIMLTRAQSAAETWKRKCREQCSWISVKERLPMGGEWILAIGVFTHKKGGWCVPHVAEMRWGKWCAQDEMLPYLDERGLRITHWMPLPEPPKEEQ